MFRLSRVCQKDVEAQNIHFVWMYDDSSPEFANAAFTRIVSRMEQANRIDWNHTQARVIRVASSGHAFFAATMVGLGVLGLVQRDFPPTWAGVPKSAPGREVLIYLCAVVSVSTGIGLVWQRASLVASRVLLVYFLAWLVLFRMSYLFVAPGVEGTWWACGDTAVMAAGAWVLYAWFTAEQAGDGSRLAFARGDSGVRIARVLYGLGLIPFGIAHFTYLARTVSLVPGWLPWHLGWAYFTGVAFIAAGVAVLTGVFARLAAVLSALEMGLFILLVWVPIVTKTPTPFDWVELVGSWTLTAAAWLVADSYRGTPWLDAGILRRR